MIYSFPGGIFDFANLRVYASNEPRIGIVRTAMGACAQIAVFTYAVMRRTPRYEIRLAAPFAANLMNSVAHCGCHLPPGEICLY